MSVRHHRIRSLRTPNMKRIAQFLLAPIAITLVISGCKRNFSQGDSALSSRQPAAKIAPTPSAPTKQNEYEIPVTVQKNYTTAREAEVLFTFKAADYGRVV